MRSFARRRQSLFTFNVFRLKLNLKLNPDLDQGCFYVDFDVTVARFQLATKPEMARQNDKLKRKGKLACDRARENSP